MKKALKVTSVLCIIYGLHYLILGVISLFAAGLGAVVGLATFSITLIGGTIGIIIMIAILAVLTYLYGMGGYYALKDDKKKALICTALAVIYAILALVIALFSKRLRASFADFFALLLPLAHGYFIIQSE